MNIELSSTLLPLRAVFKLVALGWTLGACVVIGIPLALFAVPSAFHLTAENEAVVWAGLLFPLIAVGQGMVIAALVWLGLAVYRWKRPITVTAKD